MAKRPFLHPLYFSAVLTYSVLLFTNTAAAKDCLECHADIGRQFSTNSHHVQNREISSGQCYSCHWEASTDGGIDERYHQQDHAKVDLVVWNGKSRPTEYVVDSTAVVFSAEKLGTDGERTAIGKVTLHCLGCHNDRNNDTDTFGDGKTPRQYAWDGQSIASRYLEKGITTWGKYSSSATNKKKRVSKALSAHGNTTANQGGWSTAKGYDGDMPLTRGGEESKNIECFDCHNAHGSSAKGTTSSYQSADKTFNGGLLKQTMAGKSGYKTDYSPSANDRMDGNNPYNTGAGLCFDCHETPSAGATPWGYSSTFGAREPIMGYKDTLRFGSGSKGSTARFSDRQSRSAINSSHLKAGRLLNYSAHGEIRGLCTPCHDPHGVSRTLGGDRPYAVPLLKGTWLTSPYREDGPPTAQQKEGAVKSDGSANRGIAWEKGDFSFTNREANANFGISGSGAPREPMSRAGMRYNVDRNTFGANNRISETDDKFAGLCLKCHPKEHLSGEGKTGRIHRTVKGWGNNKEHAFPCAKCHQAHNSGLPRLMQTNCFEVGPPGLRESSGLAWSPAKKGEQQSAGSESQKQSSSKGKKTGKVEIVGCHVRQFGGNPAKQEGSQWNEKTKW